MGDQRARRQVISQVDRRRLIQTHEGGRDYYEVADALGIKRRTAWTIIRRYQRDNNREVIRRRGGAHNQKIDNDMCNAAVQIVEDNPSFTLKQINANLRLQLPDKPYICVSTPSRLLHGQLITVKKLETRPQDWNRDDVKLARRVHCEWLLQVGVRELIYVDESGFNLWLSSTRGRARQGQRAVRVVGGRKVPHFSCIMAVSSTRGLIFHRMNVGGTNQVMFNDFLANTSQAAGDGLVTFVMDNASCHRRARESQLRDDHDVLFLPAYSPFLNICENAFSTWKASFKRDLSDVREQIFAQEYEQQLATLAQLGEQNIGVVTANFAREWARKILTYIPRCIRLENIDQDHA